MNGRIYPTPDYAPHIILNWYKTVKHDSECPCCKNHGVDWQSPIEYHHIDRKTKIDTISNMVYNKAPLGLAMNEMFKCMPLCQIHHRDYHQHEHNRQFIADYYNFTHDKAYQTAIMEFHAMAWLAAPNIIKDRYIEFKECGLEIFRPIKPVANAAIPNRQMLRART